MCPVIHGVHLCVNSDNASQPGQRQMQQPKCPSPSPCVCHSCQLHADADHQGSSTASCCLARSIKQDQHLLCQPNDLNPGWLQHPQTLASCPPDTGLMTEGKPTCCPAGSTSSGLLMREFLGVGRPALANAWRVRYCSIMVHNTTQCQPAADAVHTCCCRLSDRLEATVHRPCEAHSTAGRCLSHARRQTVASDST